jgi:hypothetical protein
MLAMRVDGAARDDEPPGDLLAREVLAGQRRDLRSRLAGWLRVAGESLSASLVAKPTICSRSRPEPAKRATPEPAHQAARPSARRVSPNGRAPACRPGNGDGGTAAQPLRTGAPQGDMHQDRGRGTALEGRGTASPQTLQATPDAHKP